MRNLKSFGIAIMTAFVLAGGVDAQQNAQPVQIVEPELVPDTSVEAEGLLKEIHDYYPGTEEEKATFRNSVDKAYVGKERIAKLKGMRDSLKPLAKPAEKPAEKTGAKADPFGPAPSQSTPASGPATSASQQGASSNTPASPDSANNGPCKEGEEIKVDKGGRISCATFVGGKGDDVKAQFDQLVADYELAYRNGTKYLDQLDKAKSLMAQAALAKAQDNLYREACGVGLLHRGTNQYLCAIIKAERKEKFNQALVESFNKRANLTGCEYTPDTKFWDRAGILTDRVLQKPKVAGAKSLFVTVHNNMNDAVVNIRMTNGLTGEVARNICPNAFLEMGFVVTTLFGGSQWHSSMSSSMYKEKDVQMVATWDVPDTNGMVKGTDTFRFTLRSDNWKDEEVKEWFIGDRPGNLSHPSVRPESSDGGSSGGRRRTGPRNRGIGNPFD